MVWNILRPVSKSRRHPFLPRLRGRAEVAVFAQALTHKTEALPSPHRRFDQVCAPGYQGRKRGEVVRTRTVILQAHTHQFWGTFGAASNGDYRGDLRRAVQVITSYATQLGLPSASMFVRKVD